jgi:hypothetical protein
MTRWQYRVEWGTTWSATMSNPPLVGYYPEPLNKLGADGWEVCGCFPDGRIILKRPATDEVAPSTGTARDLVNPVQDRPVVPNLPARSY